MCIVLRKICLSTNIFGKFSQSTSFKYIQKLHFLMRKRGKTDTRGDQTNGFSFSRNWWWRLRRSVLCLPPGGLRDNFYHHDLRALRVIVAARCSAQTPSRDKRSTGETQSTDDLWWNSGDAISRYGDLWWVFYTSDLRSRLVAGNTETTLDLSMLQRHWGSILSSHS